MPLFPQIITKNWQLKLAALAMAVMLWTVPRFDAQNRVVLEDIPVRVQLNDPQFAVLGDPFPATVQVTLSGPARELFALEVDRPSLLVPVDQVSASDTAVLLRFPWLRLPGREGVVVEGFSPSSVRLSFEPMDLAELPLAPRFLGVLPEGLSLAMPPAVVPEIARISGPASRLGGLDSLRLAALDLSGVTASRTFDQPIDTTGLMGMVLSPKQATLEIRVEETLERTFLELTVELPPLPEAPQLQARPATVTVVLTGARSLVQAVDSADLRVTLLPGGARTLAPGEEARVQLMVEGVPELLTARIDAGPVTLRRPAGL